MKKPVPNLLQALRNDHDAIVVISVDLRVEFYNTAFERFMSYYFSTDFTKVNFQEIGGGLPTEIYTAFTSWLNFQGSNSSETLTYKVRTYHLRITKTDTYFYLKIKNITKQHQREEIAKLQKEVIKKREEKFSTIFQAMPIAFMFVQIETTGEIVSVNHAFTSFLGYNDKKITNTQKIYDLIPEKYHPTLKEFFFEKQNGFSELDHIEIEIRDSYENMHVVNLFLSYKETSDMEYFMLFLQNISDVKRKLNEQEAQIKRLSKIRRQLATATAQILITGFAIIQSILIYIERNETDHIVQDMVRMNREMEAELEVAMIFSRIQPHPKANTPELILSRFDSIRGAKYQRIAERLRIIEHQRDSISKKIKSRQDKWWYIDVHNLYYPEQP